MILITDTKIKISVRNLVEFILRSGDLDNSVNPRDPDAMQQGSRLHRKIQKRMGPEYQPEVPLSVSVPVSRDGLDFEIIVEGRADGIIKKVNDTEPNVIIDEIKCVFAPLSILEEMIPIHRSQALCYAYIYATQNELDQIGIQLTYCHMESETIKQFNETLEYEDLKQWFDHLIQEYCKWASWQLHWRVVRNASIKATDFPFEYRPGQKDLVTGVYRTILRSKKLYIEAPTGVGKTISTIFPAVKAMGEGLLSKIFYLTAKTITRTVAEDTFQMMSDMGLQMKVVTITAKEKICVLDKPNCSPVTCERAKGHFDRVNDAVYDMLTNETQISRTLIEEYAAKHCVCPFEMGLDVTTWSDAIICDYNYVFDPNVFLRRFFFEEKKQDYAFLIDEAHNLVDRAREMYSAVLEKQSFLDVKKIIKEKSKKLAKRLDACNEVMLRYKRECDDCTVLGDVGDLVIPLMRLMTEFEEFNKEYGDFPGREEVTNLYFDVKNFLAIHDIFDEDYIIYSDYGENQSFRVKLLCMNPSRNLLTYLNKGRSAIFFSATLLPIQYYKEQLGGGEEDYAVYAPSPFDSKNRLLLIGKDVSTKYTRRSESEYIKIVDYIEKFIKAKTGNYFVFFPSYQMMTVIYELAMDRIPEIILQKSSMSEVEREEFLAQFVNEPVTSKVGFCVMGGVFSEGIDLTKDRLIGAVIVGTGLPQVCNERELFRDYYEVKSNSGFDHAYLYTGMNKVLQSAGRVIRTIQDKGSILLLDERFLNSQYRNLFPREWDRYQIVDRSTMSKYLNEFWSSKE
ncbi:MAG: ATP-dependent DNA helicase [Clostridiales bacterium]|nr:ATP-dependent DNA helicase [Clostridiales bacterium]